MKTLLAIAAFWFALPASAELCKYIDSDGNIRYSSAAPEQGWKLLWCSEPDAATTNSGTLPQPVDFVGTHEVAFQRLQTEGKLYGCSLVFKAVVADHAYKQGALVALLGNISFQLIKDSPVVTLKLGTVDLPGGAVSQPIYAYLQTVNGTTAQGKHTESASDAPGFKLFFFADLGAIKVITDMVAGNNVTIGFNRTKGGLDVITVLDLVVAESNIVREKLQRRRSPDAVWSFRDCFSAVTKDLRR